jgi:hypothetical protein
MKRIDLWGKGIKVDGKVEEVRIGGIGRWDIGQVMVKIAREMMQRRERWIHSNACMEDIAM